MNLLMVIFALIAILSVVSVFRSIKEKNILSLIFGVAAAAIFGWFVIMTVLNQGYPPKLH
ncbi:DUF2759 domain-containing protein [Ureibacillus composti]|uniref:DUF2759 domain-containing protein n=1 Tax=Lysinibacillus composti TaxID=720633 RepID=A0A3N9UK70_9BACI|nr:DUF2759 domain-containing protein [Lysinibacillus composti]MBM7607113.1 putative membrane protein [Lysinibacillus composti]MDM5334494.1 DUF2759 domain-containing protein [Ureibacillus composti]RQW76295.1 DUF2759 domain-containing protein [Lysinibacillus composti]